MPGSNGPTSSGGSIIKNPLGDLDHSWTKWGNKDTGTSNNHPPTTHKTEYKTQPSAPKFEDHKKTESTQQRHDKPMPDTPSAPSRRGVYGGYRNYHRHHSNSNAAKAHGNSNGTSTTTQKPYAPASLFNPTRLNPPYPTGNPQDVHPMPQNTGSRIGASQYSQASSQLGSSSYNPHYPTNSGSPPYPTEIHQYPGSYPQSGSYPYQQQAGYPVNTGGYHPSYPSGGSSFSQTGVVYIPSESLTPSVNGISSVSSNPDNSGLGTISNGNYQEPSNQSSGINYGNVSPEISGNNGLYSNDPNVNNPDINNPILKTPNNNQPNNANPSNSPLSHQLRMVISDEELRNLTEDIFSRQEVDTNKYIKLNLQKKVNSTNITDESPEPLFEVKLEINAIPSIELIQTLYDNYESNSQIKEKASQEKIKEQNNFLEVILQTNVMSKAMNWLVDKKYIASDMLSKKEILTRIWFTPIEGSTSAFERTFLAEKYWETSIMGLQNWVYFKHAESKKEVNYMGYMDKLDLGDKGSLIKVVFKSDEIVQPTTVFVGTLPELEEALYTVCFYARQNELCSISLGGAKFNIFTHTFLSWGKDLLDVATPVL